MKQSAIYANGLQLGVRFLAYRMFQVTDKLNSQKLTLRCCYNQCVLLTIKLNKMAGLARICKMYGSMEVSDANGKKVTWLWDYANDKPRPVNKMLHRLMNATQPLSFNLFVIGYKN